MDQYFSRLSTHIGGLYPGVYDFAGLERAIADCWTTSTTADIIESRGIITPVARRFTQMLAYREWIHQSASSAAVTFKEGYYFRIACNEEGIACVYGKRGAEKECAESEGIPLLVADLPRNHPEVVRPNYKKIDFAAFKSTVTACHKHGLFSQREVDTWNKFEKDEIARQAEWDERHKNVYPLKYDKDGKKRKGEFCADNNHKRTQQYYDINPDELNALEMIPVNPVLVNRISEEGCDGDTWFTQPEMDSKKKTAERNAEKRKSKIFESILKETDRREEFVAVRPMAGHFLSKKKRQAWICQIKSIFRLKEQLDGSKEYEFDALWHSGNLSKEIVPLLRHGEYYKESQLVDSIIAFQLQINSDGRLSKKSKDYIKQQMAIIEEEEKSNEQVIENVTVVDIDSMLPDQPGSSSPAVI